MPQYKIFSAYNENAVTEMVNAFVVENGLLWDDVNQEYHVTAIVVDEGLANRIVYKYSILLRYKITGTFQGE